MTADKSLHGKGRSWIPPTITKLAIWTETKGTETKSPVADQTNATGTNVIVEPQPPSAPASKFGFSFEWSLPLSMRAD